MGLVGTANAILREQGSTYTTAISFPSDLKRFANRDPIVIAVSELCGMHSGQASGNGSEDRSSHIEFQLASVTVVRMYLMKEKRQP